MIDMYLRGIPTKEIAQRCGHAVSTVHRHLSAAGVARSRSEAARLAHNRHVPRERILALYQMGLAGTAVAQVLGISKNVVYRVLRQEGVSRPPRPSAPRQRERMRRITEAGRLKAEGMTYKEITKALGISRATAVRYVSMYRKMLRPSHTHRHDLPEVP